MQVDVSKIIAYENNEMSQEEVIEFLDEATSIFGGDGFGVVGCCVAYFVNDAEFGEKVDLEAVFKGLLVN